jgi:hypothetical protein
VPAPAVRAADDASLAKLDAQTARNMAQRIARWWRTGDRIVRALMFVPVGGCTASAFLAPTFAAAAAMIATVFVLLAVPANSIAREIIARAVRDEMRELGFDDDAARAAAAAFRRAQRTFFPRFTLAATEREVYRQLERAHASVANNRSP